MSKIIYIVSEVDEMTSCRLKGEWIELTDEDDTLLVIKTDIILKLAAKIKEGEVRREEGYYDF